MHLSRSGEWDHQGVNNSVEIRHKITIFSLGYLVLQSVSTGLCQSNERWLINMSVK